MKNSKKGKTNVQKSEMECGEWPVIMTKEEKYRRNLLIASLAQIDSKISDIKMIGRRYINDD